MQDRGTEEVVLIAVSHLRISVVCYPVEQLGMRFSGSWNQMSCSVALWPLPKEAAPSPKVDQLAALNLPRPNLAVARATEGGISRSISKGLTQEVNSESQDHFKPLEICSICFNIRSVQLVDLDQHRDSVSNSLMQGPKEPVFNESQAGTFRLAGFLRLAASKLLGANSPCEMWIIQHQKRSLS